MLSKGGAKKAGTGLPFSSTLMPEVKPWLSLRILSRPELGNQPLKASLLISIPKKTVRLATQRNRIKRLIREVFRNKNGLDPKKVYAFRVNQYPGDIGLKEAEKIINQVIHEITTPSISPPC